MDIQQFDLAKIPGSFALFSQWAHECNGQNISAGRMVQIEGSLACMKYNTVKGGPFQGMIVLLHASVCVCVGKWLYLVLA